MGSGTGSPLEGPKGHYQGYGDLQETAIARALAGLAPSGLGYPGWDPGKVLFWRVWETSDLGCRVLDIPGMAQRARSADMGFPGCPARPPDTTRDSRPSLVWFHFVVLGYPIWSDLGFRDLGMSGLVQTGPEWSRIPGIYALAPCRGVREGSKRA